LPTVETSRHLDCFRAPSQEGVDKSFGPAIPGRRVILVAPSPPPSGGMALQARLLERLLCRDGHSVLFIASNPPFPEGLRFLDRLRGVRPFLRLVMSSIRLWRAADKADVIHVFAASWLYFFVVVWPAVLVGRLRRTPVILNYRGGEAARFFRFFGWAAAPAFKLASAVTAPSEFIAEVIRECFTVAVQIVPNIVDLSCFNYRARTGIRPRMVVARHLERSYDIESVLKAFRRVQEHHVNASLRIAGTGSQESYLRRLASTWSLRNVEFLGHVPHDDLARIYDECDIMLNASLIDNFPGALVEASAAGLVVVTTCAGGIPFLYEDGESALLVKPGDWESLAQAVERILTEPALAQRLAAKALAVAAKCDWRYVRQSLHSSYGFFRSDGRENKIISKAQRCWPKRKESREKML
jgi:glycosyltransferase involved in cell wall biosynthesis